jgi:hypothetical protein
VTTLALLRRLERLEELAGPSGCVCPSSGLALSVWIRHDDNDGHFDPGLRSRLADDLARWRKRESQPTTCPLHGGVDLSEIVVNLTGRSDEPTARYFERVAAFLERTEAHA